jgi:hypothetical protein
MIGDIVKKSKIAGLVAGALVLIGSAIPAQASFAAGDCTPTTDKIWQTVCSNSTVSFSGPSVGGSTIAWGGGHYLVAMIALLP